MASAQLVQEERRSHMPPTLIWGAAGCRPPPGSCWKVKGVPKAQSLLGAQGVLFLATEIWMYEKGRLSLAQLGVSHMPEEGEGGA